LQENEVFHLWKTFLRNNNRPKTDPEKNSDCFFQKWKIELPLPMAPVYSFRQKRPSSTDEESWSNDEKFPPSPKHFI